MDDVFTNMPVSKAYFKLSLPLVFSMVVTLVYNLADTFFVAQTNDTNLVAGVALGAPIFTFLMAIGNIFGQGGSSLISRLMGKQDFQRIHSVSAFCFYITLIAGVIIGMGMLVAQAPLLSLIGANVDTWEHIQAYSFWLAIGSPFVMASFIHSNLLRSEGLSKESMMGTVGGAVVNIILDPIMISGLGWGATGAAIATVLGYVFSVSFFVVIVKAKSQYLSLNIKEIRLNKEEITQILGIGIPAAIVNVMSSVSVVLLNQYLLVYGNEQIAAMGIVLKVNMIASLVLTGFAFGGQPLFGYFYGAKDQKKLNELMRFTLRFIGALSIGLTVAIFFGAPHLIQLFMKQELIVQIGTEMLRWQVISMFFVGMILLLTIIFQSFGKITASFILSISRQGVVFVATLLIGVALWGYTGILVSQALADVISFGIAVGLFMWQVYPELK